MSIAALDVLIWVLIYGGLLLVCLGVFVLRSAEGLGWGLIGVGAVAAVAGAALIVVRSRTKDPAEQEKLPK
jgi:hypothetical protein